MKPKKAIQPLHKMITRRDFISQGFVNSTAFVMAPTVLATLLRSEAARAADPCDGTIRGGTMPAVLIIDHAGGAGLLAQTLPFSLGDQPLSQGGYQALGMSPAKAPTGAIGSVTDSSWGIHFHRELAFATALNATAIPAAKALTNSFSTVARLDDDSSSNMINPAGGLALLGALGDTDRKLASVIGTSASESGGNSSAAVAAPLYRATPITSAASAANLVSTGQLATRLSGNRGLASKVLSAMQRMSRGQLSRFSAQDLPSQVKQIIECGYAKASGMVGDPQPGAPVLDPAQNTIAAQVFNFMDGTEQRAAALTYLLAQGFSGVATLTLGGRDYHDNTRSTGETRDREAARITAQAINLFHRLVNEQGARPRPLMIIHITDGGVSTDRNEDGQVPGFYNWTSDRGSANAAYVFMYDPAGKPLMSRSQLGYSSVVDGGVDTQRAATPFSSNAVALAEVFMINYLQLAGRPPGDISKTFQTNLTAADIAKYAVTTKKS